MRIETSSIEIGSSAITTFGSTASARAIATRWRWPPESWYGYLSAVCSGGTSPTVSSSSSTRCSTPRRGTMRWICSGRSRWCRTVLTGFSDPKGSWKIICTCERYARMSDRLRSRAMSRPSKTTLPEVGT